MRCAGERGRERNPAAGRWDEHGCRPIHDGCYRALFFLIIIGIALFSTTVSFAKTQEIRGVQIMLGDGNRICMSLEGKITAIIVNGSVNLPGGTFENITKVGHAKISRNDSGRLTRIGHIRIHRDKGGDIVKIGDAAVLRNSRGTVTGVAGDPFVSPLFAIDPP